MATLENGALYVLRNVASDDQSLQMEQRDQFSSVVCRPRSSGNEAVWRMSFMFGKGWTIRSAANGHYLTRGKRSVLDHQAVHSVSHDEHDGQRFNLIHVELEDGNRTDAYRIVVANARGQNTDSCLNFTERGHPEGKRLIFTTQWAHDMQQLWIFEKSE